MPTTATSAMSAAIKPTRVGLVLSVGGAADDGGGNDAGERTGGGCIAGETGGMAARCIVAEGFCAAVADALARMAVADPLLDTAAIVVSESAGGGAGGDVAPALLTVGKVVPH
jgi:hypothetical protein